MNTASHFNTTLHTAFSAVRRFWADDEGATLVEYVLLVALIGAVCVTAVTLLGTNTNTKLNAAATSLH